MNLIDKVKIIPVSPPVNIQTVAHDGTTYLLGDYVNAGKFGHATFIAMCGSMSASTTMTVYKAQDADGTSADAVTIDFYKITATSAASDTAVQGTAATSVAVAVNYVTVIIEVDVAALGATPDHCWLSLQCTATGTGSSIYGAVCILSEPRYVEGADTLTVIA